ncbi:fumarylacetoacetate hydrolase family protein [Leisingera sp. HS039]|uniref:fumarylacetoacetate hydrolase family protein n=1 Tax=Leisingera sp. HS039 TaxID=2818496 RepID=UPI001B3A5809|nr:fumarylacetoacetate hydrolase family protein [Leisingera sp. HS039]MBQ4826326.1 fumarylacetoacetate hydrolase family protein [Leisingera sp. HS039]
MKRILSAAAAMCAAVLLWAFLLDDDPARMNQITTDGQIVQPGVLPAGKAITMAQAQGRNGQAIPLLVVGMTPDNVTAVDLTRYGGAPDTDLFRVFDQVGEETLKTLWQQAQGTDGAAGLLGEYSFDVLKPAAGGGDLHIGSGTNFPEHAEETLSSSVFNFPKFGVATPPVTSVALRDDMLLDYEVELCVRFDRDIRSFADFEAARKGFFLCGDFTDRGTLLRMIDTGNFDSGSGFSDSKSGEGFFPSGPFLVIPAEWQKFVTDERIQTLRNGVIRQDAFGAEMILGFDDLVQKVLGDTASTRFVYKGSNHRLVRDEQIAEGQGLMSGTPEGVIFMPPTARQIVRGVVRYVVSGAVFKAANPYDAIISSVVTDEQEAGRFLMLDEEVSYLSSSMGKITIAVTSPAGQGT